MERQEVARGGDEEQKEAATPGQGSRSALEFHCRHFHSTTFVLHHTRIGYLSFSVQAAFHGPLDQVLKGRKQVAPVPQGETNRHPELYTTGRWN
jgi:hypothetical protein